MSEDLRHACGVSAIYAPGAEFAQKFLTAHTWMQPRGQESVGVAITDGREFSFWGGQGSVLRVLNQDYFDWAQSRDFESGIGQNRYSTTGRNSPENIQPISATGPAGRIYLAHNGDITNTTDLLPIITSKGVKMVSSMDSELIAHLIVHAPGKSWEKRIAWTMNRMLGSYCLTILTEQDGIYLARDPMENRPFLLGEIPGGFMAASELISIEELDGTLIREIEGGEIVRIDEGGISSFIGREQYEHHNVCPFEYIYFSAPENVIRGKKVRDVRRRAGAAVAEIFRNKHLDVQIVIGVPDSGLEAAKGVAKALCRYYEPDGIRKNPAIQRTFIHPEETMRKRAGLAKYLGNREILAGKHVAVVDDSSVRGNTIPILIKALLRAGVKEIHFLFTWWPVRRPCHFGIDMYTLEELPASAFDTIKEFESHMAERYSREYGIPITFTFLPPDGIAAAAKESLDDLCTGCFDGEYMEPIIDVGGKGVLEGDPVVAN